MAMIYDMGDTVFYDYVSVIWGTRRTGKSFIINKSERAYRNESYRIFGANVSINDIKLTRMILIEKTREWNT